ncbi:MAG: M24 family metallopeptidase, partial [Candidatus Thorarchaeota archaeon]
KKIYNDMLNARAIGFEKAKPGVKCSELDIEIKKYLKDLGYEDYLLHRTGHGLGLGAHEGPWIAEGSEDVLQENMVISIEPGIYIPEIGGFRQSDTVLITKEGNKSLTKYPDDLQSLTITALKPFKKIKGKIIRRVIGI